MVGPSAEPAQAGDDRFSQRLRQLEPVLRGYLARRATLSRDAMADVVQETFLRLLRYRDIEDVDELRWIMLRVASSVLVDRHRRARTRGTELPLDEEHAAQGMEGEPGPERVALGAEAWAVIRQAISDLPPQSRRVFLLHRFRGMSYREIADRFGVSSRTVENQIGLALARCRAALRDNR